MHKAAAYREIRNIWQHEEITESRRGGSHEGMSNLGGYHLIRTCISNVEPPDTRRSCPDNDGSERSSASARLAIRRQMHRLLAEQLRQHSLRVIRIFIGSGSGLGCGRATYTSNPLIINTPLCTPHHNSFTDYHYGSSFPPRRYSSWDFSPTCRTSDCHEGDRSCLQEAWRSICLWLDRLYQSHEPQKSIARITKLCSS